MGRVVTMSDTAFCKFTGVRTEMKLANYSISPWFGEVRLGRAGASLSVFIGDHVSPCARWWSKF